MKTRILTLLFLLLSQVMAWAQIGGDDYHPDNPADPEQMEQKYRLTLTASPDNGGYFNMGHQERLTAGKKYRLEASAYSNFAFRAWVCDGDTLSRSATYEFVMPAKAVRLTALFDYSPDNPGDPEKMPLKHLVTLKVEPAAGASTNFTSARHEPGASVSVYTHLNHDYQFECWKWGDSVVSDRNDYQFTMPDRDVSLVAKVVYRPDDPRSPNENYWDSATGTLLVDHFRNDNLDQAIRDVMGGDSHDHVKMITIVGRMQSAFSLYNDFPNCHFLDLSRVTGTREIKSYTFRGSHLTSLQLPACIEKIGYEAFSDCQELKAITCYAVTPPEVEEGALTHLPEGTLLYVPFASIADYEEKWKDFHFTILPVKDDVRDLTLRLPKDLNPSDFVGMRLELLNKKNGQRLQYVMNNRDRYTFHNLLRNTSWEVTVKNARGDVFGKIDLVEMKDENLDLTLDGLEAPLIVMLQVYLENGQEVTSYADVTWWNERGEYLDRGKWLTQIPGGTQVRYTITGKNYGEMACPAFDSTFVVDRSQYKHRCVLKSYAKVLFKGVVKDVVTGMPLAGALVNGTQEYAGDPNGRHRFRTTTGEQGQFEVTADQTLTTFDISCNDYLSQTVVSEAAASEAEVLLPLVEMKPIRGAVLQLALTCQQASLDGTSGRVMNWVAHPEDLVFTLYNKTRQKAVEGFKVQLPQLVILDEAQPDDEIVLTTSHVKGYLNPVVASVRLDRRLHGEVQVPLVEAGKLEVRFKKNTNAEVAGSLYGADGRLLVSQKFTAGSWKYENLPDGNYTLITMGCSDLFNTLDEVSRYAETGLEEGVDYDRREIQIQSGRITAVCVEEVPAFDERQLYYTGDDTRFTVNKQTITAGNYLTMSGYVDFKPEYAGRVSQLEMLFDLPENTSFVESSVMVGKQLSTYKLDGSQLVVPLSGGNDHVRFCVMPYRSGEYQPSAFVRFRLDGETVTQPVGSVHYQVDNLSLFAPAVVCTPTVNLRGFAPPRSDVEIYDGDSHVGRTRTLANGEWKAQVTLDHAYNLTEHQLSARVTEKNRESLFSEVKTVLYDLNSVKTSTVTMTYYNGWMKKNITVVFDMENGKVTPKEYSFYHGTDFTFLIDINVDKPEKVSNVRLIVYTEGKKTVTLPATYDARKQVWTAVHFFDHGSLPVNVKARYDYEVVKMADGARLDDSKQSIEALSKEYIGTLDRINAFFADPENLTEEKISAFEEELGLGHPELDGGDDFIPDAFESWSVAEKKAFLEKSFGEFQDLLENSSALSDAYRASMELRSEYSKTFGKNGLFEVKTCDGLTAEALLGEGYEKLPATDGSEIYVLKTATHVCSVDFTRDLFVKVRMDDVLPPSMMGTLAEESFADKLAGVYGQINNAISTIQCFEAQFGQEVSAAIDGLLAAVGKLKEAIKQSNLSTTLANAIDPSWFRSIRGAFSRTGLRAQLMAAQTANKYLIPLLRKLNKALPAVNCIARLYDTYSKATELDKIYHSIPKECPLNPDMPNAYRVSCVALLGAVGAYAIGDVLMQFNSDALIFSGAVASIATAGASLSVTAVGTLQKLVTVGVGIVIDATLDGRIRKLKHDIENLKCKKEDEDDDDDEDEEEEKKDDDDDPDDDDPETPDVRPIHDPSGYVYEAVASNRLQGVTATCYYKENVEDMYGDLHEEIMKWDAEAYSQKNPLFTDENGQYAWDVPQGMWQVKFEKPGYETTYSEWLPVPPPQLDVNIGMVHHRQPSVVAARAYQDAVEFEFDKYMLPEDLTVEHIRVLQGGTPVTGSVRWMNAEQAGETSGKQYVSKVRFEALQPFTADEVTLMVNHQVRSYAGIPMQDDYSQAFPVEREIKTLLCDSVVCLWEGDRVSIDLVAQPKEAAAGQLLRIHNTSGYILDLPCDSLLLDASGKATLTVEGTTAGRAALRFTVDGSSAEGTTAFEVRSRALQVAAPRSSIASGSQVEAGTEIRLSCKTKNAVIYYTLDGSCPCVDSEARKIYDGTPIVITQDVTLKAMAVALGKYDSEVAEFVYTVSKPDGITDVSTSDLKVDPLVIRDVVTVSVGGKQIRSLKLTRLNGVVVLSRSGNSESVQIDVSHLSPAVYLLQVVTDDKIYTRKLMKAE